MIKSQPFFPRGRKVSLPGGSLPEVVSPYLLKLIKETGGKNGPLGKQFLAQPEKERQYFRKGFSDPLNEDQYEVVPGLVYKYQGKFDEKGKILSYGRALWTISRFCTSYCRFCTRGREVGLPAPQTRGVLTKRGFLTDEEIKKVFKFLAHHQELNEVILSGGDPLATPRPYLEKIIQGLTKLQKKGELTIIRIGTRVPISNPPLIQEWHYQIVRQVRNPYLMVHINHSAELTKDSLKVLNNFRKKSLATVMSQTVLLKGINDSEKILSQLFMKLAEEGIRPYYLYQNDPIYWAKHFTVPIKKAINLWQSLRPKLSGLAATARFVIDTPFGFGKIPLPEGNAWRVDYSHFYDFQKKKHSLT